MLRHIQYIYELLFNMLCCLYVALMYNVYQVQEEPATCGYIMYAEFVY